MQEALKICLVELFWIKIWPPLIPENTPGECLEWPCDAGWTRVLTRGIPVSKGINTPTPIMFLITHLSSSLRPPHFAFNINTSIFDLWTIQNQFLSRHLRQANNHRPERMSSSIIHNRFFLLSTLTIPATALLIKAYLRNNPLLASRTRTITTADTLTTTTTLSPSIKIVNPKDHIAIGDSRHIYLSAKDIGKLSDEEILARFLKGFFGGWIFTPERGLIGFLKGVGLKFVPVGFSG